MRWMASVVLLLFCSTCLVSGQELESPNEAAGETGPAGLVQQDAGRFLDQDVVIIDSQAEFHCPDGTTIAADIGHRYRVQHVKDSWLWVLRQGGWIDAASVVHSRDAAEYFTARLKQDPSVANFFARGVMWSVNGAYARALLDYESCLRLDPQNGAAHNGRGNCLWALGHVDEALEEYAEAIRRLPELAAAYNNRGNAWRTLGDFDKALEDYDQALQLQPGAGMVYNNRGCCHLAAGRLGPAIDDFSAAIAAEPYFAEPYNNRGYAWQLRGEYHKAIDDYRQAAQFDDRFHRAYENAAWLRATCPDDSVRDGELALASAKIACELTSHQVWHCLTTMAAAHAEIGDFGSAIHSQLRAMSLLPANIEESVLLDCRQQLAAYRAGQPYRMGSAEKFAWSPLNRNSTKTTSRQPGIAQLKSNCAN